MCFVFLLVNKNSTCSLVYCKEKEKYYLPGTNKEKDPTKKMSK